MPWRPAGFHHVRLLGVDLDRFARRLNGLARNAKGIDSCGTKRLGGALSVLGDRGKGEFTLQINILT